MPVLQRLLHQVAAGDVAPIVAPESGKVKGWNEKDWGDKVAVDLVVERQKVSEPAAKKKPERKRILDACVLR